LIWCVSQAPVTNMSGMTRGTRYILPGAAILGALVLACVGISHIRANRFPASWDEAEYFDRVCLDRSVLENRGAVQFAKRLVRDDRSRPPGYRIAAFPAELLTPPGPAILRSLALAALLVSAAVLFMAGREIAGTGAGVLWASLFLFSVGPFRASLYFGTETTLYPAVAGCLYALARWFGKGRVDIVVLGVLAIATAVGALSKLSFLVVLIPLVAAGILLAPDQSRRRHFLPSVVGAVAGGLLFALPWWLHNWPAALAHAQYASGYPRDEFPWLATAATRLLGVPFAASVVVFVAWMPARTNSWWRVSNLAARNFILVGLAGCLPLTVLHIAGANHHMRLMTPALMAAGAAVAIPLELAGLLERRGFCIGVALILLAQIGLVTWSEERSHTDQWDWSQLRELVQARGLIEPAIVHLGNGAAFNSPQIEYPWVCGGGETIGERWLWRYEDGPVDWSKLDKEIDGADVVITAPGFLGDANDKQPLDNQYNDQLADKLRGQNDIWNSTTLHPDAEGKVEVLVFMRARPRPSAE
jgi:hypothetical protein